VEKLPRYLSVWGVIIGSPLGLFCRENSLLGFQPAIFAERWG
jgi:hypothetical protein